MGLTQGIKLVRIKDGLSNTLLVGEKHVPPDQFGIGGWDCSMYNGDMVVCASRSGGQAYPLAQSINDPGWKFGSYHAHICHFAMADGSVRPFSTTIDPAVLHLLSNMADGQVIPGFE
ncbi:MAG: DUF1559 domain-containing protein [Planctomycetes bacterium]|nr:DUF1559 domain-containing protein [Planctomycetota bacterium]